MHAPIVFVTDFGTADSYAAALAAACWRVDARLTALAGMHEVPPGNVLAAAYHAKAVARVLPPGSVICAVVDPGVGTQRAALAAEVGGILVVAPDNGLVTYLWVEAELRGRRCIALPVPADAAATFHGRDVFAPAAARLATGAALDELGAPLGRAPVLLDEALARAESGVVHGVVCVVDHFGNAVTTIRDSDLRGRDMARVELEGGEAARMVRTYADIADGELAGLIGSAGHLEIAARGGPAAELGGPARGAAVRVVAERSAAL